MSNTGNMDLTAFATSLQKARNIVCFVHPQATYDAVAGATALAAALEKTGRNAVVACEAPMRPEYSQLAGIRGVTQEIGNRDLVISFDYSEEQVDKVNYNVDESTKRFELIISPQKGGATLDPRTVEFRQAGLSADIVVLFGFHSFDELGKYYTDEKYTIDGAFTLAITQNKVPGFAKLHNILQTDGFSYSEWVYFALRQLQIQELQGEVAMNLLAGIEYATNRLQNVSNARTFETIAQLLRAGAQRMPNNPAFEYLATPIRENAPAFQTPSDMSDWNVPSLADENVPVEFSPGDAQRKA